jgi:hypothetical protein
MIQHFDISGMRNTKRHWLQMKHFDCVPMMQMIRATIICVFLFARADSGVFDLLFSAELDNVQRIIVPQDHTFFIRLRCANCLEEAPNPVAISREMAADGVRGASVNVQVPKFVHHSKTSAALFCIRTPQDLMQSIKTSRA